jgi:DNA-binding transcriptional regulator YdaS (Cro superfamily)
MRKRILREEKDKDHRLDEALAVLISSTHNKRRPLPLTEIAEWLEVAVSRLGGHSQVADRIGLSSKMLHQFAAVRRLSKPVQELFASRRLDSVDAATHLSMLAGNDQIVLGRALASGEIDTGDLRAVVQLRKAGQSFGIQRVLNRVKRSKSTQEYLAEFVVRGKLTQKSMLGAIRKYIPRQEILRLELNGSVGRLVVTRKGKQALIKTARSFRIPLGQIMSEILKSAN